MSDDLGVLAARFRALVAHPPVPIDRMMVLTGQIAADVARTTNTSVRVSRTEIGCSVRFSGPRAATARSLMRRRLGSVTGQILAAATDTVIEELGAS